MEASIREKLLAKDVLIIEDEKDVCEVLSDYCTNMGVFRNVVIAKDGQIAASKLAKQRFLLILMDINLPKRNGVDLAKQFDESNPNSIDNVLVVSGGLDGKNIPKLQEAGIKHFLVKPFDQGAFQQKVLPILKQEVARQLAS